MSGPILVPFSLTNFSKELDEISEWLKGWGISASRTRMKQYGEVFQEVLTAKQSGKIEEFAKKFPPELYYGCFDDAAAIRVIRTAFPKPRPGKMGELLKRALEGAHLLRDESQGNATARNYLFQLLFASYLRLGRIPVWLNRENDGTQPDLVSPIEGFSIDIECKRTQSPKKVFRALSDGVKQLNRAADRFKRFKHPRRKLVVLDVSKHYFDGKTALQFETLAQYEAHVEYCIARAGIALEKKMRSEFKSRRASVPPSLGIVLHLRIPAFVRNEYRMLGGVKLTFCSVADPGSFDEFMVKRLMKRIGPIG
jgi:hypothetical protein